MEYKEFISKLYIKGAGSKKAELTRNLFLSAVNDTSVITDNRNSDESYKGYNRGNSINRIAYDVINNLKQSGIEPCIEEYLNKMHGKKSENVQKICCKFKEDITDITPDNICNRIADFFIDEVLRPAANDYEKTISNTKDVSTGNVPASVKEAQKDENELAKLKTLISELNACFSELNELGSVYNCGSWLLSQDERKEKKQEFAKLRNEFIIKNKELRYYYLSFSEFKEIFEKMIHISCTVKYGVYCNLTETNNVMPEYDSQITEYIEYLKAVFEALSK